MPTSTIRLHRVLRAVPEKVYRAFLDADAMAKWLPPDGFTGKVHHLDARVGGTFRMSFTNFVTGESHSFGGEYLELTPHERIRHTDRFDDPNLPGEMRVTITLEKVAVTGRKQLGRTQLVIAGFMTHMCVSSTARAAVDLGYKATVAADAAATRDLPDPMGGVIAADALHRAALAELADRFAVVATVDQIPER